MSGMRDLFTGGISFLIILQQGQCNPEGLQMGQTGNPMKNLMNQIITGTGQFGMQNPNARLLDPTMQDMNAVMKNMDSAWIHSHQNVNQEMIRANILMQNQWEHSKMIEQEMMQKQHIMNEQWMIEMEKAKADAWGNDFIENEVLNSKETELNRVHLNIKKQAFQDAEIDEKMKNAEYNQATGDLVEMMSKD